MAETAVSKIIFELVTPTLLAVSEEVDMVVVPGVEGDFGVLRGHTPLLTTIRPGVVDIYVSEEVVKSLFIEGGFAEVNAQGCTVLAEDAKDVVDISLEVAEKRLEEAKAAFKDSDSPSMHKEIKVAEAMLIAVSNASTKH